MYQLHFNVGDVTSLSTITLVHVRNAIWILGTLLVVASGLGVVYLYRNRHRKVAGMTMASAENAKEKQRRKAEKTLLILTLYDIGQATNEAVILIMHTLLGFYPTLFVCEGEEYFIECQLFSALRQIEIAIVNASDFYILLFVSAAFRNMIKQVFKSSNTVVTI